MANSGNGWDRVAEAVKLRRVKLGMRTAKDLAENMGVSPRLVGEIENGRRESYSVSTLIALEDALQWSRGSVEKVKQGADAEPVSPVTAQRDRSELVDAFEEWAAHKVGMLTSEFHYAIRRSGNVLEAQRELEDLWGMMLGAREGKRPWTPPWHSYPAGMEPWRAAWWDEPSNREWWEQYTREAGSEIEETPGADLPIMFAPSKDRSDKEGGQQDDRQSEAEKSDGVEGSGPRADVIHLSDAITFELPAGADVPVDLLDQLAAYTPGIPGGRVIPEQEQAGEENQDPQG